MWTQLNKFEDILLECTDDGIAKLTINRPEVRNAFRPKTVNEMLEALDVVHNNSDIGILILTGAGDKAFCSGGDQKVRGDAGYVGDDGIPRLNILEVQKRIRSLPIPVIAMVAGYAIGGGHVLHVVCDLTIAADNAIFGQSGPKVGSFDGGFGSSYLARVVGQRKAREIWFLCRKYDAKQALGMGLINAITKNENLEAEGVIWAREILRNSPTSIRILKASFNAENDGMAGIQELSGYATQLFYGTSEAKEGRDAFLEKRNPDYSDYGWSP